MSATNNLEQKGKFSDFPALELLSQATEARLTGTFRFEREPQKIAVYLDGGEVIFAASNMRAHRLGIKLSQWNFLSHKDLVEVQNLPDFELGEQLVQTGKISREVLQMCQSQQITEMILTALLWTSGEWSFTPLVRVREDLRVSINLPSLLLQAARQLPPDFVKARFENQNDSFVLIHDAAFNPTPEEAYVLSRLEGITNAENLVMFCGLPEEQTKRILYALWFGGAVRRFNHKTAFDEQTIRQFHAAKFAQRNAESRMHSAELKPAEPVKVEEPKRKDEDQRIKHEIIDEQKAVETFLKRVTTAKTFYQVLDLPNNADAAEIKQTYFKLAKQFHPDKFHAAGGDLYASLQSAFSRLAQSYETLKDQKTRELYDFKLRKEEANQWQEDYSQYTPEQIHKRGLEALGEHNYNQAVALLNRAVQLEPNNAEFHARLGQALAFNSQFRHQAENEMQTAVKLDAQNPNWRILLAEYYIAVGLNKRAEGELNRLLAIHPNHAVARQMLLQLR